LNNERVSQVGSGLRQEMWHRVYQQAADWSITRAMHNHMYAVKPAGSCVGVRECVCKWGT
jgi:hypothetical protein